MIRAVLDTNVLASGLIRGEGAPGRILQCWAAGLFDLVLSDHILNELQRTLGKPYFRRATTDQWAEQQITRLRQFGIVTPITVSVCAVANHPEDDLVLATAVSGKADFLVTGDKALQEIGHYRNIAILLPVDFSTLLIERNPKEVSSN